MKNKVNIFRHVLKIVFIFISHKMRNQCGWHGRIIVYIGDISLKSSLIITKISEFRKSAYIY